MERVTSAEARAALQRFIDSHFAKDGKHPARISVPCHPNDDDMLLDRFIEESEATARELAAIRDVAPSAAELLDLRAKLERADGEREALRGDVSMLAGVRADLDAKLTKADTDLDSMRDQRDRAVSEREALRAELDLLRDCHGSLKAKDDCCCLRHAKERVAKLLAPRNAEAFHAISGITRIGDASTKEARVARASSLLWKAMRGVNGDILDVEQALGILVTWEAPRPTLDLAEIRTALHAVRATARRSATVQSVSRALDLVDAAVDRLAEHFRTGQS